MARDQHGFPGLGGVGRIVAGTPIINNPPVADTTTSIPHGLGQVPNFVIIKLECLAADLGCAIGDVLLYTFSGAADSGLTVDADSINLRVTNGATVDIIARSTFNTGNLTLASWKLTITPYLIC